jgi:hypothetical protein
MDSGDLDAFVENFAPGAVLSDRFGQAQDDLRAWEEVFLQDAAFPGSQHFYSQFVIDGSSERASVRAYVARLYQVPGTRSSAVIWQGYYTDTCVKIDGRWLIEVKRIHQAPELRGQVLAELDQLQNSRFTAPRQVYDMGQGRR